MKEYIIKSYPLDAEGLVSYSGDGTTIRLSQINEHINRMAADGWEIKSFSVKDLENKSTIQIDPTFLTKSQKHPSYEGFIQPHKKVLCLVVLFEKDALSSASEPSNLPQNEGVTGQM